MNKKLYLLVGVLLAAAYPSAWAQQKPQYSQYMMNNYILNPAVTGIEDYTDIRLGVRRQWVGLEGAPETMYASFHMPIGKQTTGTRRGGNSPAGGGVSRRPNASGGISRGGAPNRFYTGVPHHGIGGMVHVDRTGPLERQSLLASYAFHLPVSRKVIVSGGVSTGLLRNTINYGFLRMRNSADPLLNAAFRNENHFDLNLGLWAYSQDFFVGVSGGQLIPARSDLREAVPDAGAGRLQKHYFFTGGYRFRLGNDIHLIPSVMVKLAQPSPPSVDVNVRAIYADRFWVGASYRHQDAVSGLIGFNISHLLDIGYSYDVTSSSLNLVSVGSHELVLGLKLLNRGRVICPQFLW